jgi:hypothetical protein
MISLSRRYALLFRCADTSGIFADAPGKTMPSIHRFSNQRAHVTDRLTAEYFERETCVRILARQQIAKIGGHAREPEHNLTVDIKGCHRLR